MGYSKVRKSPGARKDHPTLPWVVFPFFGGILFLLWRTERSHEKYSYPSHLPTLHPCLWHRPIPSGLEDTGIILPKKKKKIPGGFKEQFQKRERMNFFSRVIRSECTRSLSDAPNPNFTALASPLNSKAKKKIKKWNLGSCWRADKAKSLG